jgi:hypothetical protein
VKVIPPPQKDADVTTQSNGGEHRLIDSSGGFVCFRNQKNYYFVALLNILNRLFLATAL